MDLRTSITMIGAVVLGIAGFFVTYFNNVRLERKKNRLERINAQLNYFYGPLLATVQSNQ